MYIYIDEDAIGFVVIIMKFWKLLKTSGLRSCEYTHK